MVALIDYSGIYFYLTRTSAEPTLLHPVRGSLEMPSTYPFPSLKTRKMSSSQITTYEDGLFDDVAGTLTYL